MLVYVSLFLHLHTSFNFDARVLEVSVLNTSLYC